ncbi:hypothetical protein TrVFT333_008984 [Trichoderma virens FT-333]|nr:hypothetical protein TrVFT333_008984 [Trichoderma virens FT-333]
MSWDLLQRFLESDVFNANPFLSVSYLSRYADHVGIHYVLCNKLRQFPYEDIEFFLPQLCHLIISVDNESMALEEFLLDLCEESVTAALLTFWLFQTYLHDLSSNPQSNAFQTCRRVYNKVQHIVFGLADTARHHKIKENVLPVTVLSSFVLATHGKSFLNKAHEGKHRDQSDLEIPAHQGTKITWRIRWQLGHGQPPFDTASWFPSTALSFAIEPGFKKAVCPGYEIPRSKAQHRISASAIPTGTIPASNSRFCRTQLLRQHYFRSQTQFLSALEGISNRLVAVPKPARMSALRAELALIGRDLPAEVDIPMICPPTLIDGAPGKSRHHRIVRLNPAEATVLNSAEKVPYLLMVEVLRDDFNFDPEAPDNQRLLTSLLGGSGPTKRLFDLSSEIPRAAQVVQPPEPIIDSVFEPTSGDLGSSPLLKAFDDEPPSTGYHSKHSSDQRFSSGATTASTTLDAITPRTSGPYSSRSPSPGSRRRMTLNMARADQPDFSALATHMRTASQMLAQLEATSGKRPKHEVAAIRAKIIASMQSLEEQSFDADEHGPTFDTIMAKASTAGAMQGIDADLDEEDAAPIDPNINASAGRDRMENDIKTGGVQRRGDRDDPSAAVFGEAWEAKKERIRKSSPYGWMKNWDLMSVIVKTGADLRQEAFACQLINVCHKIWVDAKVDVWVKLMRILVTGESSGLVETIANGVSLHSLKRSLTLASIEAGNNPGIELPPAYSIISYILQLKDRHNGNVLIDSEGHIIHIDFGFMLSNSPGSVGFEAAPFKLTHEYVDVLGGIGSPDFEDYKRMCKQAFQALRRSADYIIDLVAMMGLNSKMPCFAVGVTHVVTTLRQRFQLHLSADEAENFVETDLVAKSYGSYYTRLYDTFQYRTQGIY